MFLQHGEGSQFGWKNRSQMPAEILTVIGPKDVKSGFHMLILLLISVNNWLFSHSLIKEK